MTVSLGVLRGGTARRKEGLYFSWGGTLKSGILHSLESKSDFGDSSRELEGGGLKEIPCINNLIITERGRLVLGGQSEVWMGRNFGKVGAHNSQHGKLYGKRKLFNHVSGVLISFPFSAEQ